jgi:hypothetical protein
MENAALPAPMIAILIAIECAPFCTPLVLFIVHSFVGGFCLYHRNGYFA